MEKLNNVGGYDYSEGSELTAKGVDLITLPKSVAGTNCFNCLYIRKGSDKEGYCFHPRVLLDVTEKMCCALWDSKGALRSWETAKQNDNNYGIGGL